VRIINKNFKKKQKNHITSGKNWKTFKDYLRCIPDQKSIEEDNGHAIARCPLSHNHKNNDNSSSFVINETWSDKYQKNVVVFTCLAKCCEQSDLASFFRARLF
jgi:hypothetical protein|tara:strand:- start:2519 stop:2827 length:309 start_codon:yes stop_codon:yes gene_type:complete